MAIKKPTAKSETKSEIKSAFRDRADNTTKLTVEIDSSMHRMLKMKAAEENRPMREIVEDAVSEYLK